jgi:glutamate formiminotransferase
MRTATRLIDMEKHRGEHPRIGATDVVPFVPVAGVSMRDCVALAKKLAARVNTELRIPVYLYDAAARIPDRRDLADIRRGEYETLKHEIRTVNGRKPDYGPRTMHPTAGAVIIGARKYLIAFNVNLSSRSMAVGKRIASALRERNGGLPGVKALCFKVGGYAQISMNLVDFEKTNFDEAFRAIEKLAKRSRVRIRSAEIYGMVSLAALTRAVRTTFHLTDFKDDQVLETKIYE